MAQDPTTDPIIRAMPPALSNPLTQPQIDNFKWNQITENARKKVAYFDQPLLTQGSVFRTLGTAAGLYGDYFSYNRNPDTGRLEAIPNHNHSVIGHYLGDKWRYTQNIVNIWTTDETVDPDFSWDKESWAKYSKEVPVYLWDDLRGVKSLEDAEKFVARVEADNEMLGNMEDYIMHGDHGAIQGGILKFGNDWLLPMSDPIPLAGGVLVDRGAALFNRLRYGAQIASQASTRGMFARGMGVHAAAEGLWGATFTALADYRGSGIESEDYIFNTTLAALLGGGFGGLELRGYGTNVLKRVNEIELLKHKEAEAVQQLRRSLRAASDPAVSNPYYVNQFFKIFNKSNLDNPEIKQILDELRDSRGLLINDLEREVRSGIRQEVRRLAGETLDESEIEGLAGLTPDQRRAILEGRDVRPPVVPEPEQMPPSWAGGAQRLDPRVREVPAGAVPPPRAGRAFGDVDPSLQLLTPKEIAKHRKAMKKMGMTDETVDALEELEATFSADWIIRHREGAALLQEAYELTARAYDDILRRTRPDADYELLEDYLRRADLEEVRPLLNKLDPDDAQPMAELLNRLDAGGLHTEQVLNTIPKTSGETVESITERMRDIQTELRQVEANSPHAGHLRMMLSNLEGTVRVRELEARVDVLQGQVDEGERLIIRPRLMRVATLEAEIRQLDEAVKDTPAARASARQKIANKRAEIKQLKREVKAERKKFPAAQELKELRKELMRTDPEYNGRKNLELVNKITGGRAGILSIEDLDWLAHKRPGDLAGLELDDLVRMVGENRERVSQYVNDAKLLRDRKIETAAKLELEVGDFVYREAEGRVAIIRAIRDDGTYALDFDDYGAVPKKQSPDRRQGVERRKDDGERKKKDRRQATRERAPRSASEVLVSQEEMADFRPAAFEDLVKWSGKDGAGEALFPTSRMQTVDSVRRGGRNIGTKFVRKFRGYEVELERMGNINGAYGFKDWRIKITDVDGTITHIYPDSSLGVRFSAAVDTPRTYSLMREVGAPDKESFEALVPKDDDMVRDFTRPTINVVDARLRGATKNEAIRILEDTLNNSRNLDLADPERFRGIMGAVNDARTENSWKFLFPDDAPEDPFIALRRTGDLPGEWKRQAMFGRNVTEDGATTADFIAAQGEYAPDLRARIDSLQNPAESIQKRFGDLSDEEKEALKKLRPDIEWSEVKPDDVVDTGIAKTDGITDDVTGGGLMNDAPRLAKFWRVVSLGGYRAKMLSHNIGVVRSLSKDILGGPMALTDAAGMYVPAGGPIGSVLHHGAKRARRQFVQHFLADHTLKTRALRDKFADLNNSGIIKAITGSTDEQFDHLVLRYIRTNKPHPDEAVQAIIKEAGDLTRRKFKELRKWAADNGLEEFKYIEDDDLYFTRLGQTGKFDVLISKTLSVDGRGSHDQLIDFFTEAIQKGEDVSEDLARAMSKRLIHFYEKPTAYANTYDEIMANSAKNLDDRLSDLETWFTKIANEQKLPDDHIMRKAFTGQERAGIIKRMENTVGASKRSFYKIRMDPSVKKTFKLKGSFFEKPRDLTLYIDDLFETNSNAVLDRYADDIYKKVQEKAVLERYPVNGQVMGTFGELRGEIRRIVGNSDLDVNITRLDKELEVLENTLLGKPLFERSPIGAITSVARAVTGVLRVPGFTKAQLPETMSASVTGGVTRMFDKMPAFRTFTNKLQDGTVTKMELRDALSFFVGMGDAEAMASLNYHSFDLLSDGQPLFGAGRMGEVYRYASRTQPRVGLKSQFTALNVMGDQLAFKAYINRLTYMARTGLGVEDFVGRRNVRIAQLGFTRPEWDEFMSALRAPGVIESETVAGVVLDTLNIQKLSARHQRMLRGSSGEWIRQVMQRSDVLDRPQVFMTDWTGDILTQFKAFALSSQLNHFGRNVQLRDGMAAQYIAGQMFGAVIMTAALAYLYYWDEPEKLEEALQMDRLILDATRKVAFFGMMPDVSDAAMSAVGLDPFFTNMHEPTLLKLPVAGTVKDVGRVPGTIWDAANQGYMDQKQFRSLMRVVPMANAWYANIITNTLIEPNLSPPPE